MKVIRWDAVEPKMVPRPDSAEILDIISKQLDVIRALQELTLLSHDANTIVAHDMSEQAAAANLPEEKKS